MFLAVSFFNFVITIVKYLKITVFMQPTLSRMHDVTSSMHAAHDNKPLLHETIVSLRFKLNRALLH